MVFIDKLATNLHLKLNCIDRPITNAITHLFPHIISPV